MPLFTSDRMVQVMSQVSGAIASALESSRPQRKFIRAALCTLVHSEKRPPSLAREAYDWCAMIWENRQSYEDWETLLLLSLEVGFRHLDLSYLWASLNFTRAEYPQELIDTILNGKNSEAIADLICALCVADHSCQLAFSVCANYVVDRPNDATGTFPSRLREVVSLCVEPGGFGALKYMGRARFVKLLNRLHIGIEDVTVPSRFTTWTTILLKIVWSPEGVRHLAIQSWELLANLATSGFSKSTTYKPDVTASLLEAEEWDKLECWMGVVWMAWSPGPGITVKDLEHTTTLLFHHRPGSVDKLTGWMERWSKECNADVPEAFQQICERAHTSAL